MFFVCVPILFATETIHQQYNFNKDRLCSISYEKNKQYIYIYIYKMWPVIIIPINGFGKQT